MFDSNTRMFSREGNVRTLLEPVAFMTKRGMKIIVPAGFQTDLASIPRILTPIFSNENQAVMDAAIIHDYLYRSGTRSTRKEADLTFYEVLRCGGMGYVKAQMMYFGVRIGGGAYYDR